MREALPVLAYPMVIVGGLAGYMFAMSSGWPPVLAAYAASAACVLLIVMHEVVLPENPAWRPTRPEALADMAFLVLVQMLVPQLLALLVALVLAGMAEPLRTGLGAIWPHEWPIWGQVLLLMVLAEFPRYWLHRLSHTFGPLWRLHAVHHSPRILYSLNVGRFHPLDRGLQYLVEVAPFILLGVGPDVLGLYFVFYAVTGFYQHSNARVRLGPLNWIIAGPELHRWHHSANLAEANTNYGNKLIIWDILFGSRFLPGQRSVGQLGLDDPTYPTDFITQTTAPPMPRRGRS
ncbi:MAG: sterol desaturase family protein [Alphaproteobacteria bacterium]